MSDLTDQPPTVVCSQCGRRLGGDDVIRLAGLTVCGTCKEGVLQRIREGVPVLPAVVTEGVWQQGRDVVVRRDAEFPPRCVRCNQPAADYRLLDLAWTPAWIVFTLLIPLVGLMISPWLLLGFFLVILIAAMASRRVKLRVPFCVRHQRHHRRWTLLSSALAMLGLLLVFGPVVLLFAAGSIGMVLLVFPFLIGVALLTLSFSVRSRFAAQVWVRRMEGDLIRLGGCGPEFAATLPHFEPR